MVGQIKVVVEAVLNSRPDRVLGSREQLRNGLREHVGRGVPQYMATFVGIGCDDGHLRAIAQRHAEIALVTVDNGGHGSLGQTPADRGRKVPRSGPRRQNARGTVRKGNRYLGHSAIQPIRLRFETTRLTVTPR